MTETNVFQLAQPGTFADPLTDVLRNGARALLAHAVQAEAAAWLSAHADKLTDDGRQRLVRHGYLPEREIMTGIGAVRVRCPRVRDRVGEGGERIRFSSAYCRPTPAPASNSPASCARSCAAASNGPWMKTAPCRRAQVCASTWKTPLNCLGATARRVGATSRRHHLSPAEAHGALAGGRGVSHSGSVSVPTHTLCVRSQSSAN